MREGWKYERLGNICYILNGFAFKSSEYVSAGIRVIRITNVQSGVIVDNAPKFYPYSQKEFLGNYLLREGDLLMSLTGNVGRVGLLPKEMLPAALNQRVACLRLKDNSLLKQYLFCFLNSKYFEELCIKNSSGAAQLNMSTVWLSNVLIPIPPIYEQERIVSLLDLEFAKIDAIKANAEKQLQDAKDLFQSALKDLLTPKEGWKSSKFGDVCEYYKEQGKWVNINYIGLENIDAHTGRLIDYKSSNEVESSTLKFNKGDVLYGRLRPYLQKVIIAPFDGCCSTEIFPIKSNAINNVYLKFWLLSDAVMDIMNESCSGCRMPRANMNSFKEEYIQYPSEQEQIIIANKLVDLQNKIGEIQFNYEQTITLCNDLKQSILKDIFG